jgi:anaerobic ribonucleoside-triphosphate reductase
MEVRKSDNSFEEFDSKKVYRGICEAYNSCGEECNELLINSIISNMFIYDKISSKEIRRQVEDALMTINKSVAKVYIKKHNDDNNDNSTLKKKNDFIQNYIAASNAATGSKYDSNANVSNKNVVTMGQELYKDNNIKQNRYIMHNKIKSLYSKRLADQYIKDLESHRVYKHDETGTPGMPYCVAITMYPFLIDGLTKLGGVSIAPTDLKSFCGEFINLVYSVSSQFLGAVATPEFFMYMDYFIRKDYGEDYLDKLGEKVELNAKGRTLERVIENCFQQVVHSMNMPAGNRGYQTVFWNVGYFDKPYFDGVFGEFTFPDGTKPCWETLSWLQKKFMKWFNEERTKYVLTFPVETMAMLTDGHDIVDKEYADFTSQMWAEGHSFFCYLSDSPDSLSSCCFSKDQKTLTRSSKGINFMTFEELYNSKYAEAKRNLTIFHNGSWVKGNIIKLPNREMYKVITSNNKEIILSDNHINVVFDGEKETSKLTTDDYLMFNTNKLDAINEKNENLTYEQGFAIGAFLGDGSFGSTFEDGSIYDINFSQNVTKYQITQEMVTIANKQLGGSSSCVLNEVYNNVYPLRISSKYLASFIMRWTNWNRGTYAHNKELNLNVLEQSYEFRKGILDGWYNTDGGNSNRCYTSSPKLAEAMEVLITSLGLNSVIDISDRTDEKVIIRGEEFNRNYPLYCVRWYDSGNKRSMSDVYKWKNNSIYFKIKSIEKVQYNDEIYCFEMNNIDEPYFTLPNGLITHNCRLRNSLKDSMDDLNHTTHQFSMGTASVATGSKSVMTINLNRVIQDAVRKYFIEVENVELNDGVKLDDAICRDKNKMYEYIKNEIHEITERVHKYQKAFNEIIKDFYNANMLDVYSAGFIDMKKQYLTIGVNGLTDAAEFLDLEISPNEDYNEFVNLILETINKCNAKDRTRECMYNTEFVPGENLSVKNYNWDKNDGYFVSTKHSMYSSYFFNPEDDSLSILDKMKLHGKDYVQYLDGGSAYHANIKEHLSFEQYRQLLRVASENGTNYFTFNCKNTVCNDCGYISKHTLDVCPHCGSHDLDYLTRIIGYLKRVSSFSEPRQGEEHMRAYNKLN